jgi:hypothetical protein
MHPRFLAVMFLLKCSCADCCIRAPCVYSSSAYIYVSRGYQPLHRAIAIASNQRTAAALSAFGVLQYFCRGSWTARQKPAWLLFLLPCSRKGAIRVPCGLSASARARNAKTPPSPCGVSSVCKVCVILRPTGLAVAVSPAVGSRTASIRISAITLPPAKQLTYAAAYHVQPFRIFLITISSHGLLRVSLHFLCDR